MISVVGVMDSLKVHGRVPDHPALARHRLNLGHQAHPHAPFLAPLHQHPGIALMVLPTARLLHPHRDQERVGHSPEISTHIGGVK